ncbi:hypothetical protein M9H77_17877 [Catharanthus roseus]|uniref:Uncharacterized protein n=1 Tax=Catharanthus roseus TaxID=4058 RepID=A0ACC0B5U7_CATRO|nr:hypothetical protein M9H77_17877 [Catharanthus roseus]
MSGGNGNIQNVVQDIEALRDRMDAQEAAVKTLEVNLDQRFQHLDQRFNEMINRFDALWVNANRNKNDGGQQSRDQLTRDGVANVPVAPNVQNQVAGYNSSDEEEHLVLAEDQNRLARRGGGRYNNNYNIQHNNDYYGERNNLQESEVHQVNRYLDGLKLQIRDRIGVQVVKSVTEVKNLAIKAELMIRDRGGSRIESNRRTYDNDNFQRSNSGEDT